MSVIADYSRLYEIRSSTAGCLIKICDFEFVASNDCEVSSQGVRKA